MTDDPPPSPAQPPTTREAVVVTDHSTPETIAAAVTPDNTDEMELTVEDNSLRARIVRPTTGGLQATLDDYIVNLGVADRVLDSAKTFREACDTEAVRTDRTHQSDANHSSACETNQTTSRDHE